MSDPRDPHVTVKRYIQTHELEREKPQTLRETDIITPRLLPRPRAEIVKPRAIHSPHLDTISADLYSVLLEESQRLSAKARETIEGLDPSDQIRLQKTVDSFVKLAKLQMEMERANQEVTQAMSQEDLEKELAETLAKLKGP